MTHPAPAIPHCSCPLCAGYGTDWEGDTCCACAGRGTVPLVGRLAAKAYRAGNWLGVAAVLFAGMILLRALIGR